MLNLYRNGRTLAAAVILGAVVLAIGLASAAFALLPIGSNSSSRTQAPASLQSVPAYVMTYLGVDLFEPTEAEIAEAVPKSQAISVAKQYGSQILEAKLVDLRPRSGALVPGQQVWSEDDIPDGPVWVVSLGDRPSFTSGGPGLPETKPWTGRAAMLVLVNGRTGAFLTGFATEIPDDAK